MGNCVRQGSVKVGVIQKKKSTIKKLQEQADKEEYEDITQQTKKANDQDQEDTIPQQRKKSKLVDQNKNKTKNEHNQFLSQPNNQINELKQNIENRLDFQSQNISTHILIQIEEQRTKQETSFKQYLSELNLEKNIVNSIFQLLRDFLSHIKDTKKYWVKLKFIGYSKSYYNNNQVGGSINIIVEYNTGEMTKLRIIFSKDMEKSNFDLDTFVFYQKLENVNLVKIQDFNFRISPKYMRYYIFSESNYHETSIQQMIANQIKTDQPQMNQSSFKQMFTDILNLLYYFSEIKFTHGGINPSNVYINKQMEKDGHYIQKALLDISLSNNSYNRRNTKYKEFAFRKSSDLQQFAITILSLMSSMDINSIEEANKKSIISSKLSAPSIIQVDNDIRYMLYCILKGSDMILEFGAQEIKKQYDNSINYDNKLGLIRPNQQKNQISFCYYINNGCEIIVYSFYTKWAFGYRIYESINLDNKVSIKQSYCSGDYLYFLFEITDTSDLFISKINLRKKCLDNKSLSIIKSISDTLCKMQGIKNEEELDIMEAFEVLDKKGEESISADDFLQFSFENKIKETANNQALDFSTIISCFDENDNGKLNFYEFKNMIQYVMSSRPFISFEVQELIELPRHYIPSNIFKKGNYIYLIGGQYNGLPTNKCYKYFLKDLRVNQEIKELDYVSQKGFLTDSNDQKKFIFWSWNQNEEFFEKKKEELTNKNVINININEVLANQQQNDAFINKNNSILKFENVEEMKNAMMSQKSFLEFKPISSTKSIGHIIKIARTNSIPINLSFVAEKGEEKNIKNIIMNVYNTDKNVWSSCLMEEETFSKQNFYLPLKESGQVIIFSKENCQNAELVGINLVQVDFRQITLFFPNKAAVEQMIKGVIEKKINVAFYENSLLFMRKHADTNQFYYCTFIINEETGIVAYQEYEIVSYLGKYDRISKIPIRYVKTKKNQNLLNYSSQSFIQLSSLNMSSKTNLSMSQKQKLKINRYTIEQILAQFGDTILYSATRSSFPNIEFKILSRAINNSTEKIDDIYETLKFLSSNQLQGRIATVKEAFFAFEPTTSSIKLNLIYSNEEVGLSMAEVIANLQQQRSKAKQKLLQSLNSGFKKKKKLIDSSTQNSSRRTSIQKHEIQENQDKTPSRKRSSTQRLSKKLNRKLTLTQDTPKTKKKNIFLTARVYDLINSIKNVLICLHQLHQNKFYLKEVSPHTLIIVKEGKFFSPTNFYHENTFTTINSDIKEQIVKENAIYADYLPPQLLKAHEDGLCFNDVNYNIHKSNIYSIGLIFLQYASLKKIKGFNKIDSGSQVKLSIAISNLPYPKYIQDIFINMLKLNEEERFSATQLLDLIHQIMLKHKMDIYFPQLQYLSPLQPEQLPEDQKQLSQQNKFDKSTQQTKQEFYYTNDNPSSTLYLGGKSLLLEFKKTFKVDEKVTMEMSSIVGLTKYQGGFYSVVKYPTQPSEALPQSILKYIFVKLVGNPINPKQIQGNLICSLPQFTGRDITYLNLAFIEQSTTLIYGGAENTSVGQLDMKEMYLLFDNQNESNFGNSQKLQFISNFEIGENENEDQKKYIRIDDLKNSVGKAQIFSYDVSSNDYKQFDYDSISDDEYDESNIPECSEQDEEDQENSNKQKINSNVESDEEEEEKKESATKEQPKYELQQERTTEYFIMDQRLKYISYFKRQISIQIVKSDFSIQQRYISIKVHQDQNNKNIKQNQKKNNNQFFENVQEEILQFIPISDSLVIGLDIEKQEAFLLSLVTFKSISLRFVNEIPQAQQIQPKNVKKLAQKFYSITSQKSFVFIYQNHYDLICNTFSLDTERMKLILNQQMIILPNYGYVQTSIYNERLKTMNDDEEVKNKIILPQLTLLVKKSSEEENIQKQFNILQQHNYAKNSPQSPIEDKEKNLSTLSLKSKTSIIDRIQEEPDDDEQQDDTQFHKQNQYKNNSSNMKNKDQVMKTQKSKLGLIKQKDTIVESSKSITNAENQVKNDNKSNLIEEINESKINQYNSDLTVNEGEDEEEDEDEEEKQELESQNMDIQQIIQNQIDQNKKLLLQQSIVVSPSQSPEKSINKFKFNGSNEVSPQIDSVVNPNQNNQEGSKCILNQKNYLSYSQIKQSNQDKDTEDNQQNKFTEQTINFINQETVKDQSEQNNIKNKFYSSSKEEYYHSQAQTKASLQSQDQYTNNKLNTDYIIEDTSNFQTANTQVNDLGVNNQIQTQDIQQTEKLLSNFTQTQEKINIQNEQIQMIDDFNIDRGFGINMSQDNISQDEENCNILMIEQNF
ncbi:hypothetical protein ABPG74_015213 [Tetrahymena malaccensis]